MKQMISELAAMSDEEIIEQEAAAIADLENAKRRLRIIAAIKGSTPVIPRNAVEKKAESKAILEFAEQYFLQNGNTPTTIRCLGEKMHKSGIKVTGTRAGTTIGAFIMRSGRFRFQEGMWSLIIPTQTPPAGMQ